MANGITNIYTRFSIRICDQGAHRLNKINKDLCALANLLNVVDAKSGLYVTGVNQLLPQGPQALGQETSRI